MVRHCCVVGCVTDSRYHPDAKFFKFPGGLKKKDLRDQWVRNVNKLTKEGAPWVAKDNDVVCHRHFEGGRPSIEHPVPQVEMGHSNVVKVTVKPPTAANLRESNRLTYNRTQRKFTQDTIQLNKHVPPEGVGFPCETCRMVFLTEDACTKHQESHTAAQGADNIYTCTHCDYSSSDYQRYTDHLLTHGPAHTDNSGMRIWPCKSCGDVFTTEEAKTEHECDTSSREKESKPYTCTHCTYCTPSHADYRQHLLTHSEDSDMSGLSALHHAAQLLEFPPKDTAATSDSDTPMDTEPPGVSAPGSSDMKPYVCGHCYFCTDNEDDYKEHMTTHTDDEDEDAAADDDDGKGL